jgi:hypothetical protein
MNSPQEASQKFVDEQSHGKAVELALRKPKKKKKNNKK